jgi:hypothetical protein
MSRRKGELSSSTIDRVWPYQVAVRAELVNRRNHEAAREFMASLSVCPRHRSVHHNDVEYHVYCFSDPEHARLMRERYGGEDFNPKHRGRGHAWHIWKKPE